MKKFKFNLLGLVKYGALAAFILCSIILIIESLVPGKASGAHSDKFGDLIDIPVDKVISPESIKISSVDDDLSSHAFVGQTLTLVPIFEPKNTTFKQVEWHIDGEAIIEDDVITFLGEGIVTVTCLSAVNEDIFDTFAFDVARALPNKVKINAPTWLLAGRTAIISATFIPFYSECEYQFVTKSDCIRLNGYEVTGIKEGIAEIYAIANGKVISKAEIAIYEIDSELKFYLGDEKISQLSLTVGERIKIKCQGIISPLKDIEWSSDLPLHFVASDEFYVMPVKCGNFTVTATIDDITYTLPVIAKGNSLSENVTEIVASDLSIYLGERRSLDITMTDNGAPAYSMPRMSYEGDVISIDSVGRISALNIGTTTVTVDVNGITIKVNITVTKPPISELKILKPQVEPDLNETYPLSCSFKPVYSKSDVIWRSSDESVAVVNYGVVNFNKAGNVTISASSGGKTASVDLVVYNYLKVSTVISDGLIDFEQNDEQYTATMSLNTSARISLIFDKYTSYFDYKLTSSNEKVLAIADNTITARKTGTATVTIEYSDGFSPGAKVYTVNIEVIKQHLSDTVGNWSKLVRKGIGHFAAFLITGFFASIAFSMLFKRKYLALPISLAAGFSLAGLTELLQMITPCRGPAFSDVLLDFQGFCFAAIPISLLFIIVNIVKTVRNKKRKQ